MTDRCCVLRDEVLVGPWSAATIQDVLDSHVVSPTEGITVVSANISGNVRMTVLVAVVNVGAAVILNIFSRPVNAVVKALPLELAVLLGWGVPSATVAVVARRWWSLRGTVLRQQHARSTENSECKCGYCESS